MLSFLISVIQDFAETISEKYKHMMMKLSLRITENPEDAEEAVQDALFQLHKVQKRIEDIESERTRNYIYTVTRNAALKIKAKQDPHKANVTFMDQIGYQMVGEPDVEAFRDKYGFSEEITSALDQLSVPDKDLICYYYGAGYKYSEISEIMGVSSAALRKRMERCKRALAEIIEQETANERS